MGSRDPDFKYYPFVFGGWLTPRRNGLDLTLTLDLDQEEV